jgi:hypothetical protein
MQTLFSSLFGIFGTPQLQTVELVGMLALGVFRPDRVGSWAMFRMSVLLLVIAVSLPGLAAMLAGDMKGGDADRGILTLVLTAGGLLTASSIYCLFSCLSQRANGRPA